MGQPDGEAAMAGGEPESDLRSHQTIGVSPEPKPDGDQPAVFGRRLTSPQFLLAAAVILSAAAVILSLVTLFRSLRPNPVALPGYTGTPAVDAVIAQAAVAQRGNDDLLQVVLWALGTIGVVAAGLLGVSVYQNRWASERERRSVIAEARTHAEAEDAKQAGRITELETRWQDSSRSTERQAERALADIQRQIDSLRLGESLRLGSLRWPIISYLHALGDVILLARGHSVEEKEDAAKVVGLFLNQLLDRPDRDKPLDYYEQDRLIQTLSFIEEVFPDRFDRQIATVRHSYKLPDQPDPEPSPGAGPKGTACASDGPSESTPGSPSL